MTITDAPKIVTARLANDDSHTLDRYLATGGYEGLRKALTMTPEAVAHEVDEASLLGRGGAGFPAGRKWAMLRKNPVTYLVVNGDESEPATFKDHLLLERDPHQLIEGVLIAAYALQVTRAFIYVRGEFALGLERVQSALNDAYAHGAVGSDIFGSGFSVDVVVHPGAGAYICGEETALLESLEGKRGFPRIKPPFFPAAIGLYGQPTVVNNVETLSNLPWIVLHGGGAFASLGEGRSTGTRLFALAGHVNRPGVYELEMVKTTFNDLINAPILGGGIRHGRELKAFIPGGVSAPWFGPDQIDLPLGQDEVGEAGSMLGSGSVVAMDDHTCTVRAAWRITKFFARVVRAVHAVPGGLGLAPEDPGANRDGKRAGAGSRPAPRRLRQHRSRAHLAPPADHDLRARSVHPLFDRIGHPHVPRRVPRPHQGRGVPLCLSRPLPSRRRPSRLPGKRPRPTPGSRATGRRRR